jgi:hypothetical protein
MAKIMKSRAFNPILRGLAKLWARVVRGIRRRILRRIRVSGTVELIFNSHQFRMFSDWDDPIVDRLFFGGVDYSERTELSLFEAFASQSQS